MGWGDWRTMLMTDDELPPILAGKRYDSPSAFTPESLLREARRQKSASNQPVPDVCLLDPDGDIVRRPDLKNSPANITKFPVGSYRPTFSELH